MITERGMALANPSVMTRPAIGGGSPLAGLAGLVRPDGLSGSPLALPPMPRPAPSLISQIARMGGNVPGFFEMDGDRWRAGAQLGSPGSGSVQGSYARGGAGPDIIQMVARETGIDPMVLMAYMAMQSGDPTAIGGSISGPAGPGRLSVGGKYDVQNPRQSSAMVNWGGSF